MTATEQIQADLYSRYHAKVLSYIQGKVLNPTLAEDLCADVFLKVCEKLDSFDESKASVSTWIYTIARNTLTDYYRTRRVFSEVPETLDDGSSVEDDFCSREMLDVLADALEHLDERGRDIIILHYYSGKTLKEIAAQMNLSYAYIKTLHNKALAALRTYF